MAGRKVKPKAIPPWLTEIGSGHADEIHFGGPSGKRCIWICEKCGAPSFFLARDGKHGGPSLRDSADPRYAYAQGPCWRSKDYGVKCATPKEWRIIRHDLAPEADTEVRARLAAYAAEQKRIEREAKRAEKQ